MAPRHPIRVLFYSHDSFGLGHLRRSLSIAGALVERDPAASALVVTGSPTPNLFELPERCEIVKLPCITKDERGKYVSRNLPMTQDDLFAIRTNLITATRPVLPPTPGVGGTTRLLARTASCCRRWGAFAEKPCAPRSSWASGTFIDAPHRARIEMQNGRTIECMRGTLRRDPGLRRLASARPRRELRAARRRPRQDALRRLRLPAPADRQGPARRQLGAPGRGQRRRWRGRLRPAARRHRRAARPAAWLADAGDGGRRAADGPQPGRSAPRCPGRATRGSTSWSRPRTWTSWWTPPTW